MYNTKMAEAATGKAGKTTYRTISLCMLCVAVYDYDDEMGCIC